MNRKRVIYIGILIVVAAIISVASFSYAFLTRVDEEHGKINVVAGTLDYKLESSDLNNNNQITLQPNETKKFEIEITSLNSIETKYELYYLGSNIEVGYYSNTVDQPKGTIVANGKKKITVVMKNISNTNNQVTFGVQGGFTNNDLVLATGNSISALGPTIVVFDKGNLVYGLNDMATTTDHNMRYSISNNEVTVTALANDGWGLTTGRVYLEEGKEYIISFESDGSYDYNSVVDSVQLMLLMDGGYTSRVYNPSNQNVFNYIPEVTGEYWIRLDVNEQGKTHKFWDISVVEKNPETKEVAYEDTYGTLPRPKKNESVFLGWNGKNLFNKDAVPEYENIFIRGDNVIESMAGFSVYSTSIKPSTSYTIRHTGLATRPGYSLFDCDGNYITGSNYLNRSIFTFTTPNNACYIKFSVVVDSTGSESYRYDKDIFQLEEGTEATPYEPYYVSSTTQVSDIGNITLKAIWSGTLLVDRSILDKGTFVNVTPIYLTNQVNGTDGFTIVGTATTHWTNPDYSTYLRWDYRIDLTDYSTIKFYGRKNANHGNVSIMISDGLNDYDHTNVYLSERNNYANIDQDEWIEYTVDVSEIEGTKVVSFIGGYSDYSGNASSSTSFSNIRFIP